MANFFTANKMAHPTNTLIKSAVTDMISCLEDLLNQFDGDEVLINGDRSCLVARQNELIDCVSPFERAIDLLEFARDLAWGSGLRLDAAHPVAGGVFVDRALRWHVVIAPLSFDVAVFSLRRQRFNKIFFDSIVPNTIIRDSIVRVIREGATLLVSGNTNSGKTTCLAAILRECFSDARVVMIETIAELPISNPRWVRFVELIPDPSGRGGFPMQRIAAETLRMRPDILCIGEIRGAEAEVFLDMSITGHGGCLGTIHASSPRVAVERMTRLAGSVGQSFKGSGHKVGVVQMQRVKGVPEAVALETFIL